MMESLETEKSNAGYEYSVTRMRAMKARLFTNEDYSKFLKMDTNEIIKTLEEGEYKKEIDSIEMFEKNKIELVEHALNLNLANTINKILGFLPSGSPIAEYARRYDIHNIKTILRGKSSGYSDKDILRATIPYGFFTREFCSTVLSKAKNEKEAIEGFAGSTYYKILKKHSNESIKELEDVLDKWYYEKLCRSAEGNEKFLSIVREEIDVKNIVNLFRIKKSLKNLENAKKYFIESGSLKISVLDELLKKREDEIMEFLRRTHVTRYIPASYITKEPSMLESEMKKYIMLKGFKYVKNYTDDLAAIVGYFIAKEREISNIRIIVRSKQVKSAEHSIDIRSRLYVPVKE